MIKTIDNVNMDDKIFQDNIHDTVNIMKINKPQLNKFIDEEFKNFVKNNINNYNLLYYNNKLYNVYLTDCSIITNKNKEIILQVIYNNITNDIIIWYRRGRINAITIKIKINDANSICSGITYYNIYDIQDCINKFKNLFYLNTGYNWDDYDNNTEYDKIINKYKIIKIKSLIHETIDIVKSVTQYIPSDNNTKDFIIKIISCNKSNHVINTSYKLKLNNISEKKLYDGLTILDKIKNLYTTTPETEINNEMHNIALLTEQFIDCIPIICKHGAITNITLKQANYFIKEIIDTIPYINDIIHNDNDVFINFDKLLKRINKTNPNYNIISKYVKINSGSTHLYNITIIDIYKYNNINQDFIPSDNTCYLFHGTRFSNIYSILHSGLKIAPKDIIRTGNMFGNGIYFANCSTKSFNYCCTELYNNFGCLLLCKVSLGKMLSTRTVVRYTNESIKKGGYNSIKGMGKYSPIDTNKIYIDNVYTPIGELHENTDSKNNVLMYDEYICYDTNQVQIEYVIYCKHNIDRGISP